MKRTKEILDLIEQAFLTISLTTHYEIYEQTGVSDRESIKMLRIGLCNELLGKCSPLIDDYLENLFTETK